LKELVFVGLGLNNEKDISLNGIEEIKTADAVYSELYTSPMPNLSVVNLEKMIERKISVLSRKDLEDESEKTLLESTKRGKTVFLVPGDPLIATTHVALRIEAEKLGIKTRVVHGASILSAVVGLSGMHNYKFGKSVTIPFTEEYGGISETPYDVVAQNKSLGLHTLCLLDVKAEEKRFMTIREGLKMLLEVEERRKQRVATPETLTVGVARAGSKNPEVKADFLKALSNHDFGGPPHSIVFPGKLHFMEAEALVVLAGAPEKVRETAQ
jgi:diphthine synthase